MGQKVNPIGLRLGIIRTWDSRWFAGKDYAAKLLQDIRMRKHVKSKLSNAAVSRVIIERAADRTRITIQSARPGIIIGKKGEDIEKLRKQLSKINKGDVTINIVEVRKPDIDAILVAKNIAEQLERRVGFRRAMKKAIQNSERAGALGIRVNSSGRLGGAEIARTEWYREGRVPLHTLRADIDYAEATARTPAGAIGVKVWIYKGDVLEHDPMAIDKKTSDQQAQRTASY